MITHSLHDFASFWTLQGDSDQELRLSLPSQCFQLVHTGNHDEFMIYVKLITDYENFVWYTFIDVLVWNDDHYSKAFVVNSGFAVDSSMINDLKDMDRDNSSCILFCNSIKSHGVHEKETVALTIIKILNWVYKDKNHDKECFNGENMRNYNLIVRSQKDNGSCNFQTMLATDVFVSALLDKT